MASKNQPLWQPKAKAGNVQTGGQGPQTQTYSPPPMHEIEERPRKIKFLDKDTATGETWMIFEESDKLWASHYCSGNKEYQNAVNALKLNRPPWFHKAVDTDKSDKCEGCGLEVPKHLLMAAKIANVKI